MSRIGYSEEEDYPGQFNLWRGNLMRSIRGKKGQAALRDLEAALLALPEKRLIGHHLVKDGDVCANGALIAYREQQKTGLTREQVIAQMEIDTAPACDRCWGPLRKHGPLGCEHCPDAIERMKGWSWGKPEDWDKVCMSYVAPKPDEYDEDEQGDTEAAAIAAGVPRLVAWAIVEENDELGYWRTNTTPEQRYERLLKWTRNNIIAS